MNTNYYLAVAIQPDDTAEQIAALIAVELDLKGVPIGPRRSHLIQAGLLIEINLKAGDLVGKVLKFGDMLIAVFVKK